MEYDKNIADTTSKQIDETIERLFNNLIELLMRKDAVLDKKVDINGRTTYIVKIISFEKNIFKIQSNASEFRLFMKPNLNEDVVCIERPRGNDMISNFYNKLEIIYKNLANLELLKCINDMISITDCTLNKKNALQFNKINQLKPESDNTTSSIFSGSKSYKNVEL